MKQFLLGLFGRSDAPASPKGYHPVDRDSKVKYAVPLTIDEAGQLAETLSLIHRTSHERAAAGSQITGGVIWARDLANEISRYVGAAKAHGYVYVPVPVARMSALNHAMEMLLAQRPDSEETRAFERLHARMHVLAGMAEVHGWELSPTLTPIGWRCSEPTRAELGHGDGDQLEHRS